MSSEDMILAVYDTTYLCHIHRTSEICTGLCAAMTSGLHSSSFQCNAVRSRAWERSAQPSPALQWSPFGTKQSCWSYPHWGKVSQDLRVRRCCSEHCAHTQTREPQSIGSQILPNLRKSEEMDFSLRHHYCDGVWEANAQPWHRPNQVSLG